jgi:hypothetical protein
MSEYIQDKSIEEEGPWHLYFDNNGKVTGIGSHDFSYDVMFGMSGDFGDAETKLRYANEITRRLNAFGVSVKPGTAHETHEAMRALLDILDLQDRMTPPEYEKQKHAAMSKARYALLGQAERYAKYLASKNEDDNPAIE